MQRVGIMDEARRRHLNYDQQVPASEPQDPARSTANRELFARDPAGSEDRYFLEESRRHEEQVRRAKIERKVPSRDARFNGVPADEPDSIWQRIYRAFARHFDFDWRP